MRKNGKLPKEFLLINVNPKGRKVGDCTVRAITYASGKSWYEVFDLLTAKARELASMTGWEDVCSAVLEDLGFVKQTIPAPKKGGKRKTVCDIAKTCNKPAVLRVANHMTAVDGLGHYVDIWDCGSKTVYKYWVLP